MRNLKATLKQVIEERADAIRQRNALTARITDLTKTIEGLSSLCKKIPEEPEGVNRVAQEMLKYAGFTDVVRMILQSSAVPLNAKEIVAVLESISYPLENYKNPRMMAHVVLSRLFDSGTIERVEERDDAAYRWPKT